MQRYLRNSNYTHRSVLIAELFAVFCLLFARPALATPIITNGDFGTGDLTGWTTFTTPNGTNGTGLPDVVSFNTTGAGASNSAQFDVGEIIFDKTPQGGGLQQSFSISTPGLYSITEYFASQFLNTIVASNGDAGTFSLTLDGTTIATDSLGLILPLEILRGNFDVDLDLSAGVHTLETEITRDFLPAVMDQYVSDISVTPLAPIAVPEPSTLLLLGGGILALVGMGWRRKIKAVI